MGGSWVSGAASFLRIRVALGCVIATLCEAFDPVCEPCQPFEVLGGCGEKEFVAGTAWTSEAKPFETELFLQMSE